MRFRVRDMAPRDLDAVLAIEHVSFPTPWTRGMFVEEFGRPFSERCVAEEPGGEVVGYAVSWNVAGESHLLNIAVHPQRRGCGVGWALLRECIRRAACAGSSRIRLEVRAGNEEAQRLYRRCGFLFDGIRKNYYTDTGEDAILFSRSIRAATDR
ncbi:MAG: ribosomal protein S18-alanine N-acetyltransferase [Verrucomicrobiota bacterium]